MTERLSGIAYGVRVSFAVDATIVEQVVDALPPDWSPGSMAEATPEWTITSPEQIPRQINSAELYIAEHAAGLVFVHAGAVAFGGVLMLLPGRSFSGKSSLTDALLRAGGTYYSDEFALLRPDGTALPYPRPLALRTPEGGPHVRIAVDTMPAVGVEPARVGLVAELRYVPDGAWSVENPGPAEATLALIDNAVAAQSRPAEVLAACVAAAEQARFVRGTRADADDAARRLIGLLESR